MIRGVLKAAGIRRVLAHQVGVAGDADPCAIAQAELRLPGDLELHSMCANARRIAGLCDLMKIPAPDVATYDPDPPYIWDID